MIVERPADMVHDGRRLCSYQTSLARMDKLVARPADSPDVLLSVQHPPTITVGRRGGHEHIHGRVLDVPGLKPMDVQVHDVARGGSVTYHAPGQLVLYPVVQLPRLSGAPERFPHGDLPAFVRTLESALQATCAGFGLATRARPGFAGLWVNETKKIASIGVAVRRGWSFHGLALNVCPRLEGFDLITACALDGVVMTSMWRELEELGKDAPALDDVEQTLVRNVTSALDASAAAAIQRNGAGSRAGPGCA